MILAEELRIGNLVKDNHNRIGFILSVKKRTVKLKLEFSTLKISSNPGFKGLDIEPIELNKDWLIKLGFKPFANDWYKDGVIIHTRKRGFVINKRTPIMKTVHQLQNYYFTNKGKELI